MRALRKIEDVLAAANKIPVVERPGDCQRDIRCGYRLVKIGELSPHSYGFRRIAVVDEFAVCVLQSDQFVGVEYRREWLIDDIDQIRRRPECRLPATLSALGDIVLKQTEVG